MDPSGDAPADLKLAARAAMREGRFADALALFERLAVVTPDLWSAPYNAGLLLSHLGRPAEAEAALRRAIALAPERGELRNDLALALLAQGREEEGWEAYLWRRQAPRAPEDRPREPLPADLAGAGILLLNEQGLGDSLFFLRYAAELSRRGARLFHEPFAKLAGILSGVPWLEPVPRPAPDWRVPLGDLPYLTGLSHPPALRLATALARQAAVALRLARAGPPPYLGVTWHAGVRAPGNLVKDASPAALGAALAGWPGTLVLLQRVQEPGTVAAFAAAAGRVPADFSDLHEALDDMLCLLDRLDAHVAVSNTNVHLRAGLGRPQHVLVPWPAEFRWPAGQDRSPWFPDCRLYRQRPDGDWGPALAELAADLGSRSALSPSGA